LIHLIFLAGQGLALGFLTCVALIWRLQERAIIRVEQGGDSNGGSSSSSSAYHQSQLYRDLNVSRLA